MPTPVGHTLAGIAVWLFSRAAASRRSLVLLFFLWVAAVAPDIDYFPVFWGDLELANLNHQHYTHSIFFSLLSATALSIVAKWFLPGSTALKLFPLMLIAALSHQFFDYLTYDGRDPVGIPLLWPLDMRFNSPVSVFAGVAKGSFSDVVSLHNAFVIAREILLVGVVVLLGWYAGRRWGNNLRFAHEPKEQ